MDLEQLILDNYEKLSPTDWEIWDFIWKHRKECEQMSITEMADGANVSPGAVTRLMKKLGLDGFTEFKLTLRWQNREKSYLPLGLQSRLMHSYQETMKSVANCDYTDMFMLLESAPHIYVYGTGEVQKNAANEFKRMFMYVAKTAVFVVESENELEKVTGLAGPDDLLVILSMSGENKTAIRYASAFQEKGGKILSVTNGGQNTIALMSDFSVPFSAHYIIKTPSGRTDHHTSSIFFFTIESMFLEYLQYLHAMGDV